MKRNSIKIKYNFALYSKRDFEINFSDPRGSDRFVPRTVEIARPPESFIPSAKRMTWKWKLYRSRSGFLGAPIQLIAPGERRQFVQLCNGRGRTITVCRGDYDAPNEPYPIVITVGAIVGCPLSKIEDLVSRQTVPVFVELHLAAGVVCKIVTIVMIADSAASPEMTFGSRTELTTRSERR